MRSKAIEAWLGSMIIPTVFGWVLGLAALAIAGPWLGLPMTRTTQGAAAVAGVILTVGLTHWHRRRRR